MNWNLYLIYPLTIFAALAKLALGILLIRTRRRYRTPMLATWATLSGVSAVFMCAAPFIWSTGYWDVWRATRPLNMLLEAAITIECFWLLLCAIPNFRWMGWALVAALTAIAGYVTYLIRDFAVGEWLSAIRGSVVLIRNFSIGAMLFIGLSVLVSLNFPERYISMGARKNAAILGMFFLGAFVSMGLWDSSNDTMWVYVTSQAFGMMMIVACCLAWWRSALRGPQLYEARAA